MTQTSGEPNRGVMGLRERADTLLSRPRSSAAADSVRKAEEERRQATAERERLAAWEAAGFPRRHMQSVGALRGIDEQQRMIDQVDRDMRNGDIVVLTGPRGTGKTQIACVVAKRLLWRNGMKSHYWRWADLAAEFKAECYQRGMTERQWLRRMSSRRELLVIDDVHETRATETDRHVLTRLIDWRYGEEAATLLLGNFDEHRIADYVGHGAADRIAEAGGVYVPTWSSLRARPARAAKDGS